MLPNIATHAWSSLKLTALANYFSENYIILLKPRSGKLPLDPLTLAV